MDGAAISRPLTAHVKLHTPKDGVPPSHHVLAPAPGTTLSSYLPHWNPQPTAAAQRSGSSTPTNAQDSTDETSQGVTCLPNSIALVDPAKVVRIGFRNPWPSWHKPTVSEVWQGLEWGEDHDPAIDYAMQDADVAQTGVPGQEDVCVTTLPYRDSRPGSPDKDLDATPEQEVTPEQEEEATRLPPRPIVQRNIPAAPYTRQQKIKMAAKQLLTVDPPSFDFDTTNAKLKATWLGHAGVLVQLPPLTPNQQPIRILFDPIFSQRCSPTQVAGPMRSYPAPCSISSLPPIDLVIISHNHYDHLDLDTIRELWAANSDRLRFVVPLGNKEWFVGAAANDSGVALPTPSSASPFSNGSLASAATFVAAASANLAIPRDRVTELDWWDEVLFTQPSKAGNGGSDKHLRVVCTPAQHGSGRYGVDTNCALWSSWFLEHPGRPTDKASIKCYFGGDTGCQFHGRSFPPPPPRRAEEASPDASPASETSSFADSSTLSQHELSPTPTYRGGVRLQQNPDEGEEYPACPAFKEIVARLGAPTFLMLPVSVGATIAFLRSYVPLPDSFSPFPRISSGLTAANHMPPWDAVGVFDSMTVPTDAAGKPVHAIALAIHWGTFISGPEEVLKTLGQLKWACNQHGVEYTRSGDGLPGSATAKVKPKRGRKTMVALNHGASITL